MSYVADLLSPALMLLAAAVTFLGASNYHVKVRPPSPATARSCLRPAAMPPAACRPSRSALYMP